MLCHFLIVITAAGIIKLFYRDANDYFTDCGLLRRDIRSDYERTSEIKQILEIIMAPVYIDKYPMRVYN